MPQAILTFDLGTTACKAVLFSLGGAVLGEGQWEYPTYHPQPGRAEQDPQDWWTGLVTAGRQALAPAGAEGAIVVAIGLSTQRETVVPVDGAGRPLRMALTWMDRRSVDQAVAMATEFGRSELHARTGMLPDATFTATKLRWLAQHEPERLQGAAWLLQPKDYLIMRLTGKPATDPTLASRTLLWSIREGWLGDLQAWAGIRPEQLPPVVACSAVAGHLTPEAGAALGLPVGVPVVAGAGDRCCEALAAGVAPGGRALIASGTATNVSGALADLPATPVSGVLYTRHAVPGQWLAEQGISTGGSVLKWLRDTLGEPDYGRLDQLASSSPPGAKGLVLLPYFMGARATRWNPQARGAWLGLTLSHGRGDLARSVMEGVAMEVRACLDLLERAGRAPAELVMLGGGANSPLWCQIQADAVGRPVVLPRVTNAASLGAYLLAGQAIGLWFDPVAAAATVNETACSYAPDPQAKATYARLYEIYNRLYEAVAPLYADLAEVTRP